MAIVQGRDGKQRAVDYPTDLHKKVPAVAAAMAMKRDKHPKKKPSKKDQNQELQGAAARRLANLNKGKSDGPNSNK